VGFQQDISIVCQNAATDIGAQVQSQDFEYKQQFMPFFTDNIQRTLKCEDYYLSKIFGMIQNKTYTSIPKTLILDTVSTNV
jgi:hypothetical protein